MLFQLPQVRVTLSDSDSDDTDESSTFQQKCFSEQNSVGRLQLTFNKWDP